MTTTPRVMLQWYSPYLFKDARVFQNKEGKTYICEDQESIWEEFGDFTLKFFAKPKDDGKTSEGSWVCVCTTLDNKEFVLR